MIHSRTIKSEKNGWNWREGERERDLMALRWPRSSGGSLRSLTASITPDKRSDIFLSAFRFVLVEEVDSGDGDGMEEDEANLGLKLPSERVTAVAIALEEGTAIPIAEQSYRELFPSLCRTFPLPKIENSPIHMTESATSAYVAPSVSMVLKECLIQT